MNSKQKNRSRYSSVIIRTVLLCMILAFSMTHHGQSLAQENRSLLQQDLGFGGSDVANEPYQFTGGFSIEKGTSKGQLSITLEIAKGFHAYSQKNLEGQYPTSFKVTQSNEFKVTGPFKPNKSPTPNKNEVGPSEEFLDKVTWSAPIQFTDAAKAKATVIKVTVAGQVCDDSGCVLFDPEKSTVKAKFTGYEKQNLYWVSKFRSESGNIQITGEIAQASLAPGESTKIKLTATLQPRWHVYQYESAKSEEATAIPTMIYLAETQGWKVQAPVASKKATESKSNGETSRYHNDSVTWTMSVTAPSNAKTSTELTGFLMFQICSSEGLCERPTAVKFKAPISIIDSTTAKTPGAKASLKFTKAEIGIDEFSKASKKFWKR